MKTKVLDIIDGTQRDKVKFSEPTNIVAIPDGFVFVDYRKRQLIKYTNQGTQSVNVDFRIPIPGPAGISMGEIGETSYPYAIGVTPDENILVSLFMSGSGWSGPESEQILVFDRELRLLGSFAEFSPGEKNSPLGTIYNVTGIACAKNGTIYLAEFYGHRIQAFSPIKFENGKLTTGPINWWGVYSGVSGVKNGSFPGCWFSPSDVFVKGNKVFVCDDFEPYIHIFDLNGEPINVIYVGIGERDLDSRLSSLASISLGGSEKLIFADRVRNHLRIIDIHSKKVSIIGQPGMKAGQFLGPRGLAISNDGIIYIADTGNRRIQIIKIIP